MFLEVEEGGQDPDEEAVKMYLIRFIADLPLRLVYGLHDTFNQSHVLLCSVVITIVTKHN